MKFIRSILFVILIITTQQSFCQSSTPSQCSVLKKGKFLYLDGEDKTAYIEMNGNYQIEKSGKNSYYIESSVEWLNDCTYVMTMTKITIPNFPFRPGDKMKVSVTKIDGEIIYYTSIVNGMSWNGRFQRLKD
jgi:hypothetical protein